MSTQSFSLSLSITGTIVLNPAPSEPAGPVELNGDVEMTTATGKTLNGWSIAAGRADSNAQTGILTWPADYAPVEGGEYTVTLTGVDNYGGASVYAYIGGTAISNRIALNDVGGVTTGTGTITGVVNGNIGVRDLAGDGISFGTASFMGPAS